MGDTTGQAILLGMFSLACLIAGVLWGRMLRSHAASWRDAVDLHPIQVFCALLLVFGVGICGLGEEVAPALPIRAVYYVTCGAMALVVWRVAWGRTGRSDDNSQG